jgi:hypothetical protein
MKASSILFLSLFLLLSLNSCQKCLKGNKDVSTRELQSADIPGYTDVKSPLTMDVRIKPGAKSVIFQGEINILPTLRLEQSGSEITLGTTEDCVEPRKDLTAYLTNPNFGKLTLSGTGDITGDSLDFDPELVLDGTGNIDLGGVSANQKITLNGTGNIDLRDMPTVDATVVLNGTGDVTVWCSGTLNVTINGTGTVFYGGSPIVVSSVTGTGDVRPL